MSTFLLENKVILVTGASGGLGKAAALALAKAGATTILLARKIPRLENVYDEIVAQGGPRPFTHWTLPVPAKPTMWRWLNG